MPDRKFTTLRKRLDQLGYRQPLVIEAIPLVEKLFSDLVHTTESFKNYKLKVNNPGLSDRSNDFSEPYKNDNARLVTENNELHQLVIKSKEEVDQLTLDMKSAVHKLENENQDLRFLNSQYVTKIKSVEKESKQKSEHIITLQERNMNAVVETPGGKKKNIPFRRQRMDIESTLSHSDSFKYEQSKVQRSVTDPYVADLLGIADNRIEDMKQQILTHESNKEKLHKSNKFFKKQIESREREINRLNKQLEGGRPVEAIVTDVKNTSNNRVVAHLNIQVDYLQQANRDLEKKAAKFQELKEECDISLKSLKDRNDELCMELAAMDKMYKNLDKEKKKSNEEVYEQINFLKMECEDKQKTILDLQASSYNFKKARDEVIEENEQLNIQMKNAVGDKDNVIELYERCEKEKRRLAEKNAKLTVAERELAMELERIKISKGVLPKKGPDRLQFLVQNLEDDRDHYKKEMEELQKLLHRRLIVNAADQNINSKEEVNAMIQLMKEERDYYKKEYEMLQNNKNTRLHTPPTRETDDHKSELRRVQRERDELQKMLESFEKHLVQIQENVKSVTVERDNVKLLYEQTTEEVQRLRRKHAKVLSPSRKITGILEKAEKERDEALRQLRRARSEIQNMKVEIRNIEKLYENEKHEQEDKQRDVDQFLDKIERDNNNLNNRVSSTENMNQTLENQLSEAHKTMRKLQETLSDKESELSKLRLLLEQSDQKSMELRQKYEEKTLQLNAAKEDNSNLQETYNNIQQKSVEYKKEMKRLKTVTSSLDRERDELQQQVDDKAERLVKMDDGLRQQEQADTELKLNIGELEENLRYQDQELQSKDREIAGLEKQLHCIEEELAGFSKTREATVHENKRLLDDLSLMTEENQALHKQLQEGSNESHNLKQQIEEYAMHVRRIEDLLSQKELEREELLLQYKTLSNKADVLETTRQQSEGETVSMKENLILTQQETNYLQERCLVLEAQVEQHISTEESYENQIHELQQSVGNLENQLRSVTEEKDSILEDLYAVRELCVRLDQTRDELTKKIASQTTQQEKMEEMINATQAESDVMRKQILQEKDNINSLENIISSTREKQFFEKKFLENGLMDLENVKSELANCERERSQKETEVTSLRMQIGQLQDEVASLRKQLTTEKYERERIKQELRRKSNSPTPAIMRSNIEDHGKNSPSSFVSSSAAVTSSTLNFSTADEKDSK